MPDMRDLTEEQKTAIQNHLKLVLEKNKVTNLTRILDEDEGNLLHIEDSLLALPEMDSAPKGDYADIGSGGGFPGIPLAIATGRNTLLVESVKKKVTALAEIIQELDLSPHVSTASKRIEELSLERGKTFSVVTARALTSLPSLMELTTPLLCEGGHLIAYKSNNIDDELKQGLALQDKLALHLVSDRVAVLSDGVTERRILVFEKRGEPTVALPRRNGMAQKRPYKA